VLKMSFLGTNTCIGDDCTTRHCVIDDAKKLRNHAKQRSLNVGYGGMIFGSLCTLISLACMIYTLNLVI